MKIFALFLIIWHAVYGDLLCGDSKRIYNQNTHKCKEGKIITNSEVNQSTQVVCGRGYTKYDNTTHACENGSVVLRTPSPQITQNSPTIVDVHGTFCRKRLVLNCSGNVYESCAKKGTYDCCGARSYRPAFQSCCNDVVHRNKPQRKHVCCKRSLYPRKESPAPCQLASRNDAFVKGDGQPKRLKSKYMHAFICNRDYQYAYHMKVTGPHRDEHGRYLTARKINKYLWQTCEIRTCPIFEKRVNMRIPLDEFSPDRLRRASFLILSNYQYLDGAHFFRHEGDVVFKAQKKRKSLFKQFASIRNVCS